MPGTATTASCPRCGADSPPAGSSCARCGFVFFERPARRGLPSKRWLAVLLLALVASAGAAVVLTRESPPEAPAAVPAPRAEARLERQLSLPGSVRCPAAVRPGPPTRCQFRYPDGDTRLMLVTIGSGGALDVEVPYPAQRRPGP